MKMVRYTYVNVFCLEFGDECFKVVFCSRRSRSKQVCHHCLTYLCVCYFLYYTRRSITRMRHRSLPSAKLEMFLSSTTQSLPRRTAISRSTENILELESPKPKRNAMTSSESEGQISRLRRNPDQSLTTSSIQSNFNLSPRMSRKDRSPLAHSYQSGSMGSSADQLSDVSVDSLNEPTDTSR